MATSALVSQCACLLVCASMAAGLRTRADDASHGHLGPAATHDWPVFDLDLSKKWDFSKATLTQNNLGGAGPDAGYQAMVISQFASYGGKLLDLVITTETLYVPNRAKSNRLRGPFAQINLENSTNCTFKMQLYESGTIKHVYVDRFYFTIWDLDHGKNGVSAEFASIGPISDYFLSDESTVAVNQQVSDPTFYSFSSTTFGDKSDNPQDPYVTTVFERSHAVTVEMRNVSHFKLNFAVKDGPMGRNLLLSGDSALKPQPEPSICDAYTPITLEGPMLLNNLGGQGPEVTIGDANWMRFGAITSVDGDDVDLVITVPPGADLYQAADVMKNGRRGTLGNINIMNRSNVTLNFAFRKNSDDSLVPLSNFWFTLFDLDAPQQHTEYITFDDTAREFPFDQYFLDYDSTITHSQDEDQLRFRATSMGTIKNNVIDPNNLDDRQRKNTVPFFFEGPSTHFKFTYATTGVSHGRNLQFGFMPTILCSEGNASVPRSSIPMTTNMPGS